MDTRMIDYAPIYIGDHVSFSRGNMIVTSTHDATDFESLHCASVVVEDHVWVTVNVTILGGVTIGKGSIIGAGSVVTRDVPAGVLAGGNPCRVIRPLKRAAVPRGDTLA